MSIQRYEWIAADRPLERVELVAADNGRVVLYADHLAELERLLSDTPSPPAPSAEVK